MARHPRVQFELAQKHVFAPSVDGKVVYQLKHAIGRRTHRVMEPHQFLARLCALIPPPRHPLIRFHGVFRPASKWRAEVIPSAEPAPMDRRRCEENDLDQTHQAESRWHSQRLDWATLLHRFYDIDALRCECGGKLRFEELIESPKDARAFLALHQIESPRDIDSQQRVEPWSDAPNIALLNGLRPEIGPSYVDQTQRFTAIELCLEAGILPSDSQAFM